MIGCLILAFALCQVPAPGYYVQPVAPGYQPGYPVAYAPQPQQYYAPAPVYYPAPAYYGPAYAYGGPSINLRFGGYGGGWGGGYGYRGGWGGGYHR
jgi:hypothetical protein